MTPSIPPAPAAPVDVEGVDSLPFWRHEADTYGSVSKSMFRDAVTLCERLLAEVRALRARVAGRESWTAWFAKALRDQAAIDEQIGPPQAPEGTGERVAEILRFIAKEVETRGSEFFDWPLDPNEERDAQMESLRAERDAAVKALDEALDHSTQTEAALTRTERERDEARENNGRYLEIYAQHTGEEIAAMFTRLGEVERAARAANASIHTIEGSRAIGDADTFVALGRVLAITASRKDGT